jgi:putative membrane protein
MTDQERKMGRASSLVRALKESSMLWIKAFHVIFVVMWFAGLFYLPRLFVYHAQASDSLSHERFLVMERKLFVITSIGAAGAIVFGLWTLVLAPGFLEAGWMHAKLALVFGLLAYHVWLGIVCQRFRTGLNRRGHVYYRWMNEFPALFLFAIVILVVVKPF